jgi:four helix bundle protein
LAVGSWFGIKTLGLLSTIFMSDYRDLIVYQKAFSLAMDIKTASEKFPPDEKYSLTDQIRRSSRSVCVNLVEGYRKRRYPAHFVSKISDSDMENSETQVWVDFAEACHYIDAAKAIDFRIRSEEIGRMLQAMQDNPEKFLPKNKKGN